MIISQSDVFNIIKELGGHATANEIKDRIKEKYPDYTIYTTKFEDKLLKLDIKGLIKFKFNPYGQIIWYIANDKNVVAITKIEP